MMGKTNSKNMIEVIIFALRNNLLDFKTISLLTAFFVNLIDIDTIPFLLIFLGDSSNLF